MWMEQIAKLEGVGRNDYFKGISHLWDLAGVIWTHTLFPLSGSIYV